MQLLVERANTGLHDSLLAFVSELPRDTAILDLGCGTGAWMARLARAGFSKVTGADYEAQTVGLANFFRVDLNGPDWTPLSGRYDLITAIEVIEHIENLGLFFDGCRRLLGPAGSLILTTPNIGSLAARVGFLFRGQLKQFDERGDATHFSPVVLYTLPRILARRGLRISAAWGFPADGRTVTSRGAVNALCAVLRRLLPEQIPGDNLCVKIVRSE